MGGSFNFCFDWRSKFEAMYRRDFIVSAVTTALLRAEPEQPRTLVYKKVEGCAIKADVFGAAAEDKKPAAVWIHGGALIFGSRKLSPKSPVLRSLPLDPRKRGHIAHRSGAHRSLRRVRRRVSDAHDRFLCEPATQSLGPVLGLRRYCRAVVFTSGPVLPQAARDFARRGACSGRPSSPVRTTREEQSRQVLSPLPNEASLKTRKFRVFGG